MNENLRVVQVGGREIELVYRSPVYWLWAWYDRLDAYLSNEDQTDPGEWIGPCVFRPSSEMSDAMRLLSIPYQYLILNLRDYLAAVETALTAFIEHENDDTKEDLLTLLGELAAEIGGTILVILADEAPDKPEQVENKNQLKGKTERMKVEVIREKLREKMKAGERRPKLKSLADELGCTTGDLYYIGFNATKLKAMWYDVSKELG